MFSKFLQFTNHPVGLEMTEKTVNHGVGSELEIPITCFFMEMQELQHG